MLGRNLDGDFDFPKCLSLKYFDGQNLFFEGKFLGVAGVWAYFAPISFFFSKEKINICLENSLNRSFLPNSNLIGPLLHLSSSKM